MRRAAAVCVLAACVPDRPIARVNEQCREEMAEVVYHHACQHGRLGPFEPVVAVAARGGAVPAVDGTQRVLDVTLPPGDPDGLAYVAYVATRGGQHALFAGADHVAVPVAAYRGGARLPATPIEPMPDLAACGGMVEVTGLELEAGERYLLELGPSSGPALRMFIEHLATFGEEWSERCVD